MGKSGENLPKVIQPFSSCAHQLPAHRGCFWRVKPVTEVPPLLVQGPAAEVCPWASIRAVQPWAPPAAGERLSAVAWGGQLLRHLLPKWFTLGAGGGVYNPPRGLAGSRGKGLCPPSRTAGIAALCRSLTCSQSGEEADERWISHLRTHGYRRLGRAAGTQSGLRDTKARAEPVRAGGLCWLRHGEHRERAAAEITASEFSTSLLNFRESILMQISIWNVFWS